MELEDILIFNKAKARINAMSEDALQAFIFQTCWNNIPKFRRQLFSVPNGGERHNGNKYKATGLVAGIPDLIFYDKNLIIFFELKKPIGGTFSSNQKLLKSIINKIENPYFLIKRPTQFFYAFISILMNRKLITGEEAVDFMKAVQDEEGLIFFGLTEEQFRYEIRVFDFIFNMENGKPEDIYILTEPETRERFKDAIKKFIHLEYDYSNDFQLVFSENFITFVKQPIA